MSGSQRQAQALYDSSPQKEISRGSASGQKSGYEVPVVQQCASNGGPEDFQFEAAYPRGTEVYNLCEKDSRGNTTYVRRWVCCIDKLPDGRIVYWLKDKPPTETGSNWVAKAVAEEDLQAA